MKKIFIGICSLLLALYVYTSCNKIETVKEGGNNHLSTDVPKAQDPYTVAFFSKIENAKAFFNKTVAKQGILTNNTNDNIVIKSRQQVGKMALWEGAYIAKTKAGKEVVIVPIKYEKSLQAVTSFGNGRKTSIETLSNLWIYKNGSNNYVAEVVTVLPNEKYQNSFKQKVSGYILVEDWAGNNIKTHFVKDGKSYTRKKKAFVPSVSNSSIAAREICDAINWYLCDVDDYGYHSNCVYQFTELLDCYDNGQETVEDDLDNGDLGGGSIEDVESMNVLLIKLWSVYSDAYATVISPETVKGVKSFSNASPTFNYFTSITHGSSYLDNHLHYTTEEANHNILVHDVAFDYGESANGTTFSKASVSSAVSCHYKQQALQQDANGNFTTIPYGLPQLLTKSNTVSWGFSDVF